MLQNFKLRNVDDVFDWNPRGVVVFMYSLVSCICAFQKTGHSFSDFVLTVCSYSTNGKFWGIAIAYKIDRNMQLDKIQQGQKWIDMKPKMVQLQWKNSFI